jgi:hypothetical protein
MNALTHATSRVFPSRQSYRYTPGLQGHPSTIFDWCLLKLAQRCMYRHIHSKPDFLLWSISGQGTCAALVNSCVSRRIAASGNTCISRLMCQLNWCPFQLSRISPNPTLFFVASPHTQKHTHKPWPTHCHHHSILSSHSVSDHVLCTIPIPIAIVSAVACLTASLP